MSYLPIIDLITQVFVFGAGVSALLLAGSSDPRRRMYGGIVGMCGEPFWLATTVINKQWPVVLLVVIYFFAWWRVFENNRKLVKEKSFEGI